MISHDPPARSKKDAEIIADALLEVAKSLDRVATQIKYLGNGKNGSEMGAIEGLAMIVKQVADSNSTRDELRAIADALEGVSLTPRALVSPEDCPGPAPRRRRPSSAGAGERPATR